MAENRGTVFIKTPSFQRIKGRGREIIHWMCLIAKSIFYIYIKSLAVPLVSCAVFSPYGDV